MGADHRATVTLRVAYSYAIVEFIIQGNADKIYELKAVRVSS